MAQDGVSVFGDLQRYCEAQYRAIDALCRVNRKYLASLLSEDSEGGAGPEPQEGDTLPITFDPPLPEAFKEALLRERRAWIAEVHRDGRRTEHRWEVRNMSESSNVIGNLRSRPRYRKGAWQREGIQSLIVSIRRL